MRRPTSRQSWRRWKVQLVESFVVLPAQRRAGREAVISGRVVGDQALEQRGDDIRLSATPVTSWGSSVLRFGGIADQQDALGPHAARPRFAAGRRERGDEGERAMVTARAHPGGVKQAAGGGAKKILAGATRGEEE